ncbi:hypothetical protein J2S47_002385 [Streptomyces griseoviridis]|uniref:Uncharacterized protein n=1 Tax=Streptomyces griseoviridis TaxID=45398 RepID=A0ABT9LE32_STRGD|nr:hypothetical protein [Streptomyces griseoviridis]GGS71388.1 hypothetical protein GCM10010240_00020 [Streptomyces griseoviridis]
MTVRRVVPAIPSEAVWETRAFYGALGRQEAMGLGWIVTPASPSRPTARLGVMPGDRTARPHPA